MNRVSRRIIHLDCLIAFLLSTIAVEAFSAPPQPARPRSPSAAMRSASTAGRPTQGRTWKGMKIEGLLLNARMVQGIFDDLNPETVGKWAYPDTGKWDPERNTREFVAAMPEWRRHGLLASRSTSRAAARRGTRQRQPWHNSAITPEGTLRPEYMARLEKILDRADELGMVAILGIFYFGQDQRAAGRGGRDAGPRRRGRLGLRPRLPQRADRSQQRVQRAATTTPSCSPSGSTS